MPHLSLDAVTTIQHHDPDGHGQDPPRHADRPGRGRAVQGRPPDAVEDRQGGRAWPDLPVAHAEAGFGGAHDRDTGAQWVLPSTRVVPAVPSGFLSARFVYPCLSWQPSNRGACGYTCIRAKYTRTYFVFVSFSDCAATEPNSVAASWTDFSHPVFIFVVCIASLRDGLTSRVAGVCSSPRPARCVLVHNDHHPRSSGFRL